MERKKVLVFGTFDLLHAGHIFFLNEAARLGSELVAVVARDESVEKLKGRPPIQREKERLGAVGRVECVSRAVLGNDLKERFRVILEERPETLAFGFDQQVDEEALNRFLEEHGLKPRIERIGPHRPQQFKSSRIREELG